MDGFQYFGYDIYLKTYRTFFIRHVQLSPLGSGGLDYSYDPF